MSQRAPTIAQVQKWFSSTLKKELGVEVEVTAINVNKWSLCGLADHASKAMEYLSDKKLGVETARVHDDELESTFIYFSTGA